MLLNTRVKRLALAVVTSFIATPGEALLIWSSSTTKLKDISLPSFLPHDVVESPSSSSSTTAFKSWFENAHSKTFISPLIDVCEFGGGLRGIGTTTETLFLDKHKEEALVLVKVPKAITLQDDYTKDNWDVRLALQLCREKQNEASATLQSEYFAMLPSQPAAHAIRQWTPSQRQWLTVSPQGERLLALADRQSKRWKDAYAGYLEVQQTQPPISWELFHWAMETVNSRTFCGLSNPSGILWRSIGAPLMAGVVGMGVVNQHTIALEDGQLPVLGLMFTVIAALPTIMQIVQERKPELVYFLPFVEFFNHSDDVRSSSIRWDPFQQCFSLLIGSDCLKREQDDEPAQVFINYGDKTDSEWLQNFGFLPGVMGRVPPSATEDELRRFLAEEFVKRNAD